MNSLISWIGSFFFNIGFVGITFILFSGGLILRFLPQIWTIKAVRVWASASLKWLRIFTGIRHEVKGLEYLKAPCIIASKHQSAWDTIIFHLLINNPAYVLKKELLNIPLFKFFPKRLKLIVIDRSGGRKALKALLEQSKEAIEEGRMIVIFPEGTRSLPDAPASYQTGVAALYKTLNVPVIPVALNSGHFWGRRTFFKKKGLITLEFLPPIPPGLKPEELMVKLKEDIEESLRRLPAP